MNENPELTFTISLTEANALLAGLQELPGKVCNPLTKKLVDQANAQIEALQKLQDAETAN